MTACCRKGITEFLLLWPVLRAACSHYPSPVERLDCSTERTWQQTESRETSLLLLLRFPALCVNISLPVFPFCDRPTLEPQSVFLCSEVCVLLVPFAWGQALFSVKVLRVYPNVQDLGVSARLSESGGTEEKRHAGQDSCWNL